MLAVVKFSFWGSPLEFSYIPSLLIMTLCPFPNKVFRSPWWTAMGWVWLCLWRSTGLPCLFHVRSCSGSSCWRRNQSWDQQLLGGKGRQFAYLLCSSKLHVEQSRGRVTWGRKTAIQILNLLPLHKMHLTFYMENTYPKHFFLIPAWGAPDPGLLQKIQLNNFVG